MKSMQRVSNQSEQSVQPTESKAETDSDSAIPGCMVCLRLLYGSLRSFLLLMAGRM